MYVFLKEGPIHICKHRNHDDYMLIRGWSKEAIERFLRPTHADGTVGMTANFGRMADIWYDENADYYWRVEVPTYVVQHCMDAAVRRITYDSLKAGVAADGNHEYYDQLVAIHALEKALLDERERS